MTIPALPHGRGFSLLPSPFSLSAYTGSAPGNRALGGFPVKKFLGIFALIGAAVGAVMFWRRRQDDDEFLDEELE
jgi:hypothetical protein